MNHPDIFIGGDGEDVVLEHVIINLEGTASQYLNCYSSPSPVFFNKKLFGRQALVSDECHRIIAKNNNRIPFLVCHYYRPITLGHITVELLPSGASPGSSFLFVQKKEEKLLFASHWSKRNSPSLKRAFVKKAQTLLIKLRSDPSQLLATNSRRECDRFIDFCKKITAAGENIIVVTDPFEEGMYLASILADEGLSLATDSRLLRLFKLIQQGVSKNEAPQWLQKVKSFKQISQPSVIMISRHDFLHHRLRVVPRGIWVWIGLEDPTLQRSSWLNRVSFADRFLIQNAPDNGEILSLISEVSPTTVLIYGEGAKNCVTHLQRQGVHAELFLPPRMDTLF